jgi:hypothetical protein
MIHAFDFIHPVLLLCIAAPAQIAQSKILLKKQKTQITFVNEFSYNPRC